MIQVTPGCVDAPTASSVTTLTVRSVRNEADGIRSFRLEHPDGHELAPWEPGAHLDVVLPSGLIRQYSLCGDPADRLGYVVAVLDQPTGRGGSREFHEVVRIGASIEARGPKNHFPLVDADTYLFIAGGIGITPMISMVREVIKAGKEFRFVYGGRSLTSMAFVDDVREFGDAATLVPEDSAGRIDVVAELARSPVGTAVYCCGPEPLLRVVEEHCADEPGLGGVHFERFGSARLASDAPPPRSTARTFDVELARTGLTIEVDQDSSILDRVLEVVPDQPWACREGYCGTCETVVLSGEPEHADEILTDGERAANNVMMICVGRSRSACLVLDI